MDAHRPLGTPSLPRGLAQWLCVALSALPSVHATTTIKATASNAYGANLGWIDWRGDVDHGAEVHTRYLSGYLYSANVGWINLGNGSPANGLTYANDSATDYGVNRDAVGNLTGYAYGANVGWIAFQAAGSPQINPTTGQFTGSAYSANCGWISLDTIQSDLITDLGPPPTAASLDSFRVESVDDAVVQVVWMTVVDARLLGFHVDWAAETGTWRRLTSSLIPAIGADGQPQTYSLSDPSAPQTPGTVYRLVAVDLSGVEKVLAQTTLTIPLTVRLLPSNDGWSLALRGAPESMAACETATEIHGPWNRVETVQLDAAGVGTLALPAPGGDAQRFYRLKSE